MFFKDKASKVIDGLTLEVNAGHADRLALLILITQMLSLMGNREGGGGGGHVSQEPERKSYSEVKGFVRKNMWIGQGFSLKGMMSDACLEK